LSRRRKQQVEQDSQSLENSPGAVLRVARESAGFTAHDVADALNLTHTVIQHLEDDVYDELPGLAFSVGYLRAYAKFLDLDADTLVEQVKKLSPASAESTLVVQAVPVLDQMSETQESSSILLGSLLVVGVVVSAALIWWFLTSTEDISQATGADNQVVSDLLTPRKQVEGQEQKPLQLPESATRPQSQPVQQEARSVAEAIQSNVPSLAVSFEKTLQNSPDESEVIQQLTAAQNSGAPADAPPLEALSVGSLDNVSEDIVSARKPSVYENGARRITAEGDQLLEFSFSSDSWVGVQNTEMDELYGDLNRSGTSLRLIGQGPFRVLLGYAPGVTLSVDGVPVDLVSRTRNNVARVVVAQ